MKATPEKDACGGGENTYRLLFDYHTHTSYSHGSGSVEDNLREALKKGLRGLAISDHGPGHLFYGIKRSEYAALREDITALSAKYPEIELYMSVESNICGSENGLDITPEESALFDFLIAGYHYGVKDAHSVGNYINTHFFPTQSRKLKIKNTENALKALYCNRIKILTHPGDKGPFDLRELARACAERGVWFEANEKHGGLSPEAIEIAMEEGASFVLSSDAHRPEDVGSCDAALAALLKAGVPLERIVNLEPGQTQGMRAQKNAKFS